MATADQLKALIQSHTLGDDERFFAVALQVAAKEARNGHAGYAQELKELIDSSRGGRTRRSSPVPVATPRGDLASLLSVDYFENHLDDLAFDKSVRTQLERVIREQRQRSELTQHGFLPLRRLLFVGPPGTGKTMSARVLSSELRLPMFTVRLDGLITKFMGETAAKLRLVFEAMSETTGVYLFDEVDALAGARSSGNDVGEIRRVLNSFLQFLEQDRSDSIIIATSNLPELLDRALFRRFDLTVEYPLPTGEIARAVIENRLAGMALDGLDWRRVKTASKGLSHAEITLAAERSAKDAILDRAVVTTNDLVMALRERKAGTLPAKTADGDS